MKYSFYVSYSSITKLLTFLRSSPAEASAVFAPFMTSADPFAMETVFCAIFVAAGSTVIRCRGNSVNRLCNIGNRCYQFFGCCTEIRHQKDAVANIQAVTENVDEAVGNLTKDSNRLLNFVDTDIVN